MPGLYNERCVPLQPIAGTDDFRRLPPIPCRVVGSSGARADGELSRTDAVVRVIHAVNAPAGMGTLWNMEFRRQRWQVNDTEPSPRYRGVTVVALATGPTGDEA